MMDIPVEASLAERRIRPYVRETPLEHSLYLSELTGAHVFLKLENMQYTGSFKVRGAMNKTLTLKNEQRARGVVTASSGNHGIAVAFSLQPRKTKGIVFVPNDASPTKIDTIRRYGAEVHTFGDDCAYTEEYARSYAQEHDMIFISPYNDEMVIAGQGTISVELIRQLPHIDAVFVSVGGGGLISGIAGYLRSVLPDVHIVGCLPENSPVMAASIQAQQIVSMESLPTLSDGTAGGIEADSITFPLCQQLVDEYILLSEAEIADAMKMYIETHHQLIEGSAALPVAAILKRQAYFQDQNVVLIICGANVSSSTLKHIL